MGFSKIPNMVIMGAQNKKGATNKMRERKMLDPGINASYPNKRTAQSNVCQSNLFKTILVFLHTIILVTTYFISCHQQSAQCSGSVLLKIDI
jgi:hypothetical protein